MKYITVSLFSFISIFLNSQPSYSFGSNYYSFKTVAANKTIKKIKVKLVVAVIKSDGSLLPVPRTDFEIKQYSVSKIENDLIKKHKEKLDSFANTDIRNCKIKLGEQFGAHVSSNDMTDCIINETRKTIEITIAPDLNKALAEMKKKYPVSLKYKTDLSGTTTIELPIGTWFISGEYSFTDGGKKTRINWDQKIEVKQGLDKIELSNDNGSVFSY